MVLCGLPQCACAVALALSAATSPLSVCRSIQGLQASIQGLQAFFGGVVLVGFQSMNDLDPLEALVPEKVLNMTMEKLAENDLGREEIVAATSVIHLVFPFLLVCFSSRAVAFAAGVWTMLAVAAVEYGAWARGEVLIGGALPGFEDKSFWYLHSARLAVAFCGLLCCFGRGFGALRRLAGLFRKGSHSLGCAAAAAPDATLLPPVDATPPLTSLENKNQWDTTKPKLRNSSTQQMVQLWEAKLDASSKRKRDSTPTPKTKAMDSGKQSKSPRSKSKAKTK